MAKFFFDFFRFRPEPSPHQHPRHPAPRNENGSDPTKTPVSPTSSVPALYLLSNLDKCKSQPRPN